MALGRGRVPGHGVVPSRGIVASAGTLTGSTTVQVGPSCAGAAGAELAPGGPAMIRERPSVPDAAWIARLDRLVEDFLRYHLDSYRGLRALGAFSGAGSAAAGSGSTGRGVGIAGDDWKRQDRGDRGGRA